MTELTKIKAQIAYTEQQLRNARDMADFKGIELYLTLLIEYRKKEKTLLLATSGSLTFNSISFVYSNVIHVILFLNFLWCESYHCIRRQPS